MVVSEKLKKIIALVKKIPYDIGDLNNRKSLQNRTITHHEKGIVVISRLKDDEVVFAGTYLMLKELHPQLKF